MVYTKILGMTAGTLLAALTVSPAFAHGQVGNSSPQTAAPQTRLHLQAATGTDTGKGSGNSSPQAAAPQTRLHLQSVSGDGPDSDGKKSDESEGIPGY